MTATRVVQLVLILLLVNLFASCSLTKGKKTAEAGVARFHEQYNNGKFREIYAESDEGFKKATTEGELITLLEAVHRKLGNVKHAEPAGWGVNATTNGTMANLGFEVEFVEGKGTEQFVFHITGDKAQLFNYNVNSPLLILK